MGWSISTLANVLPTCVHPSTAPGHQGVSICKGIPRLHCYSPKVKHRLSTHVNWLDDCFSFSVHPLTPQQDFSCFDFMGQCGVPEDDPCLASRTCETRIVFRHTTLLFPHLSSLCKLLHCTVKYLVLTCDTATQHPPMFKLRKTKTQYSPCEEDAGRWSWSVGDKRLRSASPAESKTISRPTQMPLNIFTSTLSQGLVKRR